MRLKLYITFILLCLISICCFAQEEEELYSLNQTELRAMNAMTLADVIRKLPFVFSSYGNLKQDVRLGAHDFGISGIYKDDLPLFMDQNVDYNLQIIDLNNIEKVVIKSSHAESYTKNSTGINIYLYSIEQDKKENNFSAELGNSTNNDFITQIHTALGNKRHGFGIGLGRTFQNGLKKDVFERSFDWASYSMYNVSINYVFKFYDRAKFQVNYGLNLLDVTKRGDILEGTTRVSDQISANNQNWLNFAAESRLSKTHFLTIKGQFAGKSHYNYIFEKDLSNAKTEKVPVTSPLDSTRYLYTLVKVNFEKRDTTQNYTFNLGVEFSNLNDRYYQNIKALKIGYTDYALTGNFTYNPIDKLDIGLGLRLLSNNSLGNYVLPYLRLKVTANKNLSAELKHLQSAVYPDLYKMFYPTQRENIALENNPQLRAAIFRVTNFQVFANYDDVKVRTGMMFTSQIDAVSIDYINEAWINKRLVKDLKTYVLIDFKKNGFVASPAIMMHGLSHLADTVSRFYFVPDLAFKLSYYSEKNNFGIYILGKLLGQFSTVYENADEILLNRTQSRKSVDVSFKKSFLNQKLNFYLGACNIFDVYRVDQSLSRINDFDEDQISSSVVPVERGRNFFLKLHVNL